MELSVLAIVFLIISSELLVVSLIISNEGVNFLGMFLTIFPVTGFPRLRISTMKLSIVSVVMICVLSPVLLAPLIYPVKMSLLIAFDAFLAPPVQSIRSSTLLTKCSVAFPLAAGMTIFPLTMAKQADMLKHRHLFKSRMTSKSPCPSQLNLIFLAGR